MNRVRPMSRLIPLVAIGISLLAVLLLAEIALRLTGVSYPFLFEHDADRGGRHRPGAEGLWTQEGRSWVRINSDGLRDREHALAKPPNTLRIAILGDSYAEAFQVDVTKTFWAVMEREVVQCAALDGRPIEAINFGVSGYGTALEWITLQKDVWKYDPDIVLLAFLTGNDIRNNSWLLERDPKRTYFAVRDGQLHVARQPDGGPTEGPLRPYFLWLIENFRLFQLANHVRQTYWHAQLQRAATKVTQGGTAAAHGAEEGLDDGIYIQPSEPVWKEAWEVTEAIIRQMNREITERRKQFFIATLSNGIQVHPNPAEREAYANRLGVPDLFYPDRRIIQLAEREGIPSAMLAPALRTSAENNKRCVHGFDNASPCGGHWNEHGHRLAGEILAQEICRLVSRQARSH